MAYVEIFKRAGQPLDVKNQVPILVYGNGTHDDFFMTIHDINALFETKGVRNMPLKRAVMASLFYLQEGAIESPPTYRGEEGGYEFAIEEYPYLYYELLRGLSDEALENMRRIKRVAYIGGEWKGLAEEFYWRIKHDRALSDIQSPEQKRLQDMQMAIDALKMFDPKKYAGAHVPDREYLGHRFQPVAEIALDPDAIHEPGMGPDWS